MRNNVTQESALLTKVVWIVAFMCVLILVHLALRYAYYWHGMEHLFSVEQARALLDRDSKPEILVMGNSHAMVGINVREFENAVNATSLAEGCVTSYHRLERLLDRHESVRLAILSTDLVAFNSSHWTPPENTYGARYVDYLDLARTSGQWRACAVSFLEYKMFPYVGSSEVWIDYLLGKSQREVEKRHERLRRRYSDLTPEEAMAKASDAAHNHFKKSRPLDPLTRQYLDRFANLCDERDVQLILIRFPMSRPYLDAVEPYVDVAEWDAFLAPVLSAHPDAVFLDYLYRFEDKLEWFSDANHLNAEGARQFTEILIQDLTEAGILNGRSADSSAPSREASPRDVNAKT